MYNVLLVDDEKLTLDYLSLSIPKQDSDWSIANVCYDGISALEWLEDHKADLIITDIKMPEMTGLELCQAVLEKNPQQKIIILSGYDEFQFAQQAIKFGVKDYLLKPISLTNLKETLETIKQALNAEQTEEYMYDRLLELSEEGKLQIVSRFIQAIINDSYVETKSLHPIIHRMKINLLDGAGIIMKISWDEDILLSQNVPVSDLPLYKYILYRLTLELAEQYPANIWVSLDQNEDVVTLLSAETYHLASNLAENFLDEIKKNKFPYIDLTLSAGQSTAFEDILMINDAYQEASIALDCRLLSCKDKLYIYDEIDISLVTRIKKLREYIQALYSVIIKEQSTEQSLYIDAIIALIPDAARKNRIAIGRYLVQCFTARQISSDTNQMRYVSSLIPQLATESNLTLRDYLLKVIRLLSSPQHTNLPAPNGIVSEGNIVDRAKQYIRLHYASPISLALIAEEIGVSPNYLSTLFHTEAGESYIKYLTGIRMENAVNYMKSDPCIKIYEIAEKVGYINVKHFSYVFKQYYRTSPGEYQQKILKEYKTL